MKNNYSPRHNLRITRGWLCCLMLLGLSSCSHRMVTAYPHSPWVLTWEERFDGPTLDSTVWTRTTRGNADWANTQSDDPRLVTFRNGCVVLHGIINDHPDTDPAPHLTGGIWTRGLKAFPAYGRFEIRARLHAAQGAWPAIWLLPFDGQRYPWPNGGEIDIMERLNGDAIAYQTVHSPYTLHVHPAEKHGSTAHIDPDAFNVYGVDINPDSICFHINHQYTYTYRRNPKLEGQSQYPYGVPLQLLIDMQLGGNWVGEVSNDDLPVEMEIDWVRFYEHRDRLKKRKD